MAIGFYGFSETKTGGIVDKLNSSLLNRNTKCRKYTILFHSKIKTEDEPPIPILDILAVRQLAAPSSRGHQVRQALPPSADNGSRK